MKRINSSKAFWLALVLLGLTAVSVAAQHGYRVEKRVEFAAGKTNIQVKGRIPNTLESHDYSLHGEEGQRISVGVFSPKIKNVEIIVSDADYNPLEKGSGVKSWSGKLPKTGDYHIIVASISGPVTYTLDINKYDE